MKLFNIPLWQFIVGTLVCAMPTYAAFVVDISARDNTLSNPVYITLSAGLYDVIPISREQGGAYTAWQDDAANPNTWTHKYSYNSNEFSMVHVGGTGSGPYYPDELSAFQHALPASFTLAHAGTVEFFIWSGFTGFNDWENNVGGVSLSISPSSSPSPTPSALFLGILGLSCVQRLKKGGII